MCVWSVLAQDFGLTIPLKDDDDKPSQLAKDALVTLNQVALSPGKSTGLPPGV